LRNKGIERRNVELTFDNPVIGLNFFWFEFFKLAMSRMVRKQRSECSTTKY